MARNERPGVYSSYEVTSSVRGSAAGGAVGIAAAAEKLPEDGAVVRVVSRSGALAVFGEGSLTELCAAALRCGAGAVYAAAVAADAAAADYQAAFAALCRAGEMEMMVCDSRDAAVHSALRETILTAPESAKYRIGVVESTGTVGELTAAARAVNSERMVLCAAEDALAPGLCAASFAGAAAGTGDPAMPINGAELFGLALAGGFTDDEINELVRGGVTVLEQDGANAAVLRAVTTRTTTGGAEDATWREVTTVRVIDEVIPGIRTALRRRFARAKNTEQTRGAIRTQVVIELRSRLERQIIDGYGDVAAEPDEADPTVCVVSFSFTVAHGLNHIELTARITV